MLNAHRNFDKAVRYCSRSCSVKPVQALKLAAGGPHPPCPHSHPPTGRSLCLEKPAFHFGRGPLAWSSPSPDKSPSGLGLYWFLRWPAAVPGRGQADQPSAPPHHLETRRYTCREKHRCVIKALSRLRGTHRHLFDPPVAYLVGNPRFSKDGSTGWMSRCWGFEKWK